MFYNGLIHSFNSRHKEYGFMAGELTRREFLKETASKTTLLSVTGIGVGLSRATNLKEAVRCTNCGSFNIHSKSYLSSFIYPESLYCHDCGININTLKHDIICENSSHCVKKNSINSGGTFACCQIPFPNHRYLKNTKKPNFSLEEIKF